MKLQEKLEQWQEEKKAIFANNLAARIIEVGDDYVVVEGVSPSDVIEGGKVSLQKVTIPFARLEIHEGNTRAKYLLEKAEAMTPLKK